MIGTIQNLDAKALSFCLECNYSDLLHLADNAPGQYHEIKIEKRGKSRIIEIPTPYLKKKQKMLLTKVFYPLKTHPRLYGGPGSSIKKAATDHVRKPIVITIDIKNFFPNVNTIKIREMLHRRKASKDVAELLIRLTTYKNHLPHGSPTSPCIGRLILNPFAINLEKMLRRIHPKAFFSIYVDDIIISGPLGIKRAIRPIYQIIKRYGFEPNERKTKVMDYKNEQASLSIRLNRRIEPTTAYLKEVEALENILSSTDPKLIGKKAHIQFLFKD